MTDHPSTTVLEAGLGHIRESPTDNGVLHLIIVRPVKKERLALQQCMLSLKHGVEGDHWAKGCWKSLPDGSPDPDVQVAIMNSRCLDLIATAESRWPLAGDNLIVDLDLSVHNLNPGQKLSIGAAILEITAVPHTGCHNFRERFGIDALNFVSTQSARELRLRGIYARVIQDGEIRKGDRMKKID